jgi:putative ABC transport system permease protein
MMDLRKLITRSFFHYFRANILASGALAIATAVITGALIIGDTLSHSLEKAVTMRLGNVSHSITAGERLFTIDMGNRFAAKGGVPVSSGLVAEGMAVTEGGRERLNRVQVLGVDENFGSILGTDFDHSGGGPGGVVISENIARRLNLETGDFFQLRMKRTGVIPMNTPLISDADQSVARRVRVTAIAGDDEYGRFNLRISQTAPYNVFVDIKWLNSVMGLEEMANILFLSSPGADQGHLENVLGRSWDIEDANLSVSADHGSGMIEISSGRVFMEDEISTPLRTSFPGSMPFLTYFVNSLEKGSRSTPYSFVTSGHRYQLEPGETVISRWLADDLSAATGDSILMRYWETGPLRELTERETWLIVKHIVEMEEVASDSILMPHLPGLSDAGNCRDWDAGVPVVLERIRDRDEQYWDKYRGTPKAYISLDLGRKLWSNRFGNLTSLWLPAGTGMTEAREIIRSAVSPVKLGFQVNELRDSGLRSAARGVDFGMLFGGLGFFVMLSGIMLFFLLQLFNMEKRSGQARLFSSLGYNRNVIRKIYLGEGMLVAFAGTIAGLLLAILYARIVHLALTGIWLDIVRTDMLEMDVRPSSLVAGFIVSIAIAFLVIFFSLNRNILNKPAKAYAGGGKNTPLKIRNRFLGASVFGIAGIVILLRQVISGTDTDPVSFFMAGGFLIPAFLLLADAFLLLVESKNYSGISITGLSMKNLARNRTRSLSVIILLALGVFVVIATGSHRKDAASGEIHPAGGTGGFLFIAEATVPVLYDLNRPETQLNFNIPAGVNFIQFMASYADDASCLNLNEVANPRILSVDPSRLKARFSLAKVLERPGSDDIWQMLNMDLNGTGQPTVPIIPAIADQAVIQWGMGKKVGDTLTYTDERGGEIRLLLVGGLANSVFQGNVIISEKNFLTHFPSASGSSFFLVDAPAGLKTGIREELEFIFRDHGWEMETTVDRLNGFNSVENTYLGIFLMLGGLGLLLGVVGLAVVMARSIVERRKEIALYIALGFKRSRVTGILFREYLVLLAGGFAAGLPPALIAGMPSLLPGSQSANPWFLVLLTTAIFINGILWIIITLRLSIRTTGIITTLGND